MKKLPVVDTPVQITARGFILAAWWKDAIHKKVHKLGEFYRRILFCRVVVEAPPQHSHKGRLYKVRVDLEVPGGFIAVDREAAESFDEALERSFAAAARKLQDFARRRRGEVKRHQDPSGNEAQVRYVVPEPGYGFLLTGDGREIYFHCDSVLGGLFHRLTPGSRVRFVEEEGEKGPQARSVRLLSLAPRAERRKKLARRLPHSKLLPG